MTLESSAVCCAGKYRAFTISESAGKHGTVQIAQTLNFMKLDDSELFTKFFILHSIPDAVFNIKVEQKLPVIIYYGVGFKL